MNTNFMKSTCFMHFYCFTCHSFWFLSFWYFPTESTKWHMCVTWSEFKLIVVLKQYILTVERLCSLKNPRAGVTDKQVKITQSSPCCSWGQLRWSSTQGQALWSNEAERKQRSLTPWISSSGQTESSLGHSSCVIHKERKDYQKYFDIKKEKSLNITPTERKKSVSKKWLTLGLGKGKYKMTLQHPVLLESKDA